MWCGEAIPTPALIHWMRRLPHASFTNLYGPTETTIASSTTRSALPHDEREAIPIGRACDGESYSSRRATATRNRGRDRRSLYPRTGLAGLLARSGETDAVFLPAPGGGGFARSHLQDRRLGTSRPRAKSPVL